MRFASALAVLCTVAIADAKGLGSSSRTYARPQNSRNNKIWKYAAAGAAGVAVGAGAYYVGSKLYRLNSNYRSYGYDDYDSYYRSRNPGFARRKTDCRPQGGLREADTGAYIVAQMIFRKDPANYTALEVEVDLFNELLFRSPCDPPTQVVSLYQCRLERPRQLTDADRRNVRVCAQLGDIYLSSEHVAARRKLLAEDPYVAFEVAVGADSLSRANRLGAAFREAMLDSEGLFKKYYNAESTLYGYELVDVEAAPATACALLTTVAAALLVLLL